MQVVGVAIIANISRPFRVELRASSLQAPHKPSASPPRACGPRVSPPPPSSPQVLEKILESSRHTEAYLYTCSEKLSNPEMRQSRASGETNDAVRHLESYAHAESSCMPKKALEEVIEMIKSAQAPTYYEAFLGKDLRRGEYEVYKCFKLTVDV